MTQINEQMNLFPFPAPFWREKAYCVEPKYLTLKEEDNKWNTKNIEVELLCSEMILIAFLVD